MVVADFVVDIEEDIETGLGLNSFDTLEIENLVKKICFYNHTNTRYIQNINLKDKFPLHAVFIYCCYTKYKLLQKTILYCITVIIL